MDLGERVEADNGYLGDIPVRTPNDYGGILIWRKMKAQARARHEAINAAFKQFNILGQTFRHSRNKHMLIVNAIAAIIQSEIEEGNIAFNINYEIIRNIHTAD